MIVFDIDNTIIDMREMIAYVLKAYDTARGTRHFDGLRGRDLRINENQVDTLLADRGIEEPLRQRVLDWYLETRWRSDAILESHRPFAGVMEVIRWFQMQPRTFVGLNTGRPEAIRADTLRSLNALGEAYKVSFRDDLLHMNPGSWDATDVTASKADGIRAFEAAGYRVFAVVDNEPDNLESIAAIDKDNAILLLHADTIFDSQRSRLPVESVSGSEYDLTALVSAESLPEHVQFVWRGVNDEGNLRQFIASDVRWGECDVRQDVVTERVVLRHDSFNLRLRDREENLMLLDDVLPRLLEAGKSVKIDLKEVAVVDPVLEILDRMAVDDRRLWLTGEPIDLGAETFKRISRRFPKAIVQCPVGFLAPLVLVSPTLAHRRLEELTSWGINRFSVAWRTPQLRPILDRLDKWGYDVNLYDVPDLEAFLAAVLLQPRSVTSDFNFPQWNLYGRGAGENSKHHVYALDRD